MVSQVQPAAIPPVGHVQVTTRHGRCPTLAGLYGFKVIDGIQEASPAAYVRRLRIGNGVHDPRADRMQLGAFVVTAFIAGAA